MDAVLGLSVTSSAVGLVLVEGQDADGAAMTGTGVEVATSQQAAEAVRRTEALAAQRGQRVQSIGVTWSDDARTEASLLLKELTESGHNIVPVQLSEATDALARGIAEVVGYHTTAVCVVEPGQLIALVVTPDDGAVQTAVNTSVITEEDLIGWLSAVFARADWEPEALVLVGSAEDLDGIAPVLEDALAVPVFSPAEAQLALARGAALACTPSADGWWLDDDLTPVDDSVIPQRRAEQLRRVGPVAMLTGGLVALVVSVSAALGMQFVPERPVPPVRPAAEAVSDRMAPVAPVAPIAPPPPPVAPPPVEEAPATEEPAPELAPVEEAPASEPAPIESTDPLPVDAAPPPPPPVVAPPPVPEERPGILQRIRDRLAGVRDEPPVVEPAPPPPPPLP